MGVGSNWIEVSRLLSLRERGSIKEAVRHAAGQRVICWLLLPERKHRTYTHTHTIPMGYQVQLRKAVSGAITMDPWGYRMTRRSI